MLITPILKEVFPTIYYFALYLMPSNQAAQIHINGVLINPGVFANLPRSKPIWAVFLKEL
jgi:hypothetical protein